VLRGMFGHKRKEEEHDTEHYIMRIFIITKYYWDDKM
jgi:hypothetical protein